MEASNGVEALQVHERHNGKIDLLFTDVVMPGAMYGPELAKNLKEKQPDLQVLYTTGYSSEAMGLGDEVKAGFNFLQKPYGPPALTAIVRKLLDQKAKPI